MASRSSDRKRERGAIAALTGIFMLMLAGMTVVGVDVARLAFTASEVQTVAEVAATGYAHAWVNGLRNGSDSDATDRSAALASISQNMIDGAAASDGNIQSYERGVFHFDTYTFSSGGSPDPQNADQASAVRATATATVNNFFATLFGTPQSTVDKTATATLTCGNKARTLPLVVGDCLFDAFDGPDDCSELPGLTQQTVHIQNSCWTSLSSSSSANVADLRGYIETLCGTGSTPPPAVAEGQDVLVTEGEMTPLCRAVAACYDAGVREFLVPVVSCEQYNRCAQHQSNSLTVSGFAKIELSSPPQCTAAAADRIIALEAFCNSGAGTEGIGGSTNFGCLKVAMVQ